MRPKGQMVLIFMLNVFLIKIKKRQNLYEKTLFEKLNKKLFKAKKFFFKKGIAQANDELIYIRNFLHHIKDGLTEYKYDLLFEFSKKEIASELEKNPNTILNTVNNLIENFTDFSMVEICVKGSDVKILEENFCHMKNIIIKEDKKNQTGGLILRLNNCIVDSTIETIFYNLKNLWEK